MDLIGSAYSDTTYTGSFYYFENNDPSIGIEEREIEAAVYPNPTQDVVNIQLG